MSRCKQEIVLIYDYSDSAFSALMLLTECWDAHLIYE